jgi:orotidine-5'-phosphate decarboxylase
VNNLRGFSGFREMLAARQKAVNSLVCVGLDPLPEKLPVCLERGMFNLCPSGMTPRSYAIANWMIQIVNATAPFTSLFKPQEAHWEAFKGGIEALWAVVKYIHLHFPDIPVFLDCKRGDINRTQSRYKEAHLGLADVDGMNFSPYMGKECMQYLIDKEKYPGRALVGLCYTSNKSARETQDVKLADGRLYWEFMAETVLRWAEELDVVADAGLVMAAAYELPPKGSGNIFSHHLSRVREIVRDKLWFLIPGIGTQEGFAKETVQASFAGPGSIAINSSSGIIFASDGDDFAEAAAKEAKKLRDDIRTAGGNC